IQALPPEERADFVAQRRAEYAADIDLLRLASELIVDAVIEPEDLRGEVIRRLDVYAGRVREWPAKHRPVTPV
ncbi:MAG TPA: acyl-CoA carboxylase subunit beta, partial [Bacillota bacterium]